MVRGLRHAITIVTVVVALMSGILSLLREFLLFQYPTKFQESPLFWACLRIAFGVSLLALWYEERKKRIAAEDLNRVKSPPTVAPRVEVHFLPSASSPHAGSPMLGMRTVQPDEGLRRAGLNGDILIVEFRIRHLSGRPATSVEIKPIYSQKGCYSIRFSDLSFLANNEEEVLKFEVWKLDQRPSRKALVLGGGTNQLGEFVWDAESSSVSLPFMVWFRDGAESLNQRFRLLYDRSTDGFQIVDEYPPLNTYYENS